MKDKSSKLARFTTAILITSDRCSAGISSDKTIPALSERLSQLGFSDILSEIVPDEVQKINLVLKKWVWDDGIHLILISGGTGVSPRDVTPEATLEIIERRIPGIEEAMRRVSIEITPHAMLSRAVVGIASNSLIINLPGSTKGAIENFAVVEPIIKHALELIAGEDSPHEHS